MNHIPEIVDHMAKNNWLKSPPKRVINKIIARFLQEAKKEILEGNIVEFPGKIGMIKVNKNIQNRMPPLSKTKLYKEGKRVAVFNPNTIGYWFSINSKSEFLERYGIKFKASPSFRSALSSKLNNGFDNYTMTWIPKKSQ